MINFIDEIKRIPYFRIVIPFILGIIVQQNFHFIFSPIYITIFLLVILIVLIVSIYQMQFFDRWWRGILIYLFLFLTSITLTRIYQQDKKKIPDNSILIAMIIENPIEKENSYKTILKINQYKSNSKWRNANTKIIAYFQKNKKIKNIEYGDKIIFQSELNKISTPLNPNEFNYARYLRNKKINYQTYITEQNWGKVEVANPLNYRVIANRIKLKVLSIYDELGLGDEEYSVLAALTVGYKSSLSFFTVEKYAIAGAMHILAVSGLHLGIIFLMLSSLFSFLDYKKKTRILKAIIIILCLWFYATITNFSPSILRAATMFSFVIVGQLFYRNTNIYNSIFASAFFLILFNPMIISEVGFQLSYLAVIGVVFFQPKFYKLLVFKNYFIDKIWSITTVSIAAMLVTSPIGMFYFHYFPVYFIITNIFVIPLATAIIFTTALTLFFYFSEFFFYWAGFVLKYLLIILNKIIESISLLPFSSVDDISVNFFQLFLQYFLIIFLSIFAIFRRVKYLRICLVLIIVIFTIWNFRFFQSLDNKKIAIYSIRKENLISVINKKENCFICLQDSTVDYQKFDYHTKNYLLSIGVRKNIDFANNKQIYFKNNLLLINDFSFLLLNDSLYSKLEILRNEEKINLDFLILDDLKEVDFDVLIENFDFNKMIISSKIKQKNIKKIREELKKRKIKYYDVNEKGAFVIDYK